MGGGLMQLVAYGAQDIYLTGNPQITFFKVVYRRHTNFSMEAIEQTINGNPTLGGSVECTISRNGDLVGRTYIQLEKGAFEQTVDDDGKDYVGSNWTHALLKQIEVEIGGQLIDRHYGHWLTVYNDLTTRNESAKCFFPDSITGQLRNDFKDYAKVDFTNLRRMFVKGGICAIEGSVRNYWDRLAYEAEKDNGVDVGPDINGANIKKGRYYTIVTHADATFHGGTALQYVGSAGDPPTGLPALDSDDGAGFIAARDGDAAKSEAAATVREFFPGKGVKLQPEAGMIIRGKKQDVAVATQAWVALVHNGTNNNIDSPRVVIDDAAQGSGGGLAGPGNCVLDFIVDDSLLDNPSLWSDQDTVEFWDKDTTDFTDYEKKHPILYKVEEGATGIAFAINGEATGVQTGVLALDKCAFNQHVFNQSLDYWARKPFDYGTEYQLMSGAMGGFRPISKDDYYKITPRINDVWGALPDFPTSRDFPSETCYIPLQFWFCRNPGLALPLIALQYHEVKIKIDFSIRECFSASTDVNWTDNLSSNLKLFCDYIYLDTDERRRFAQVSHEYLIEQLQFEEFHEESTKQTLTLNHPVKEIIWTGIPMKIDYSVDVDGVNEGGRGQGDAGYNEVEKEANSAAQPTVLKNQNYHLQLNGHDRMAARPLDYFTKCQVWQHHTGVGSLMQKNSIAVYSFALKPEEHQPSGTCNFSRIDVAELISDKNFTCNLYAVNYNVLRIMSGMGGLAYSN